MIEADREAGLRSHDRLQRFAIDDVDQRVVLRHHGRAGGRVLDETHLAENLAGTEQGKRNAAAVLRLLDPHIAAVGRCAARGAGRLPAE